MDAPAAPPDSSYMVALRVKIPRPWRDALHEAASTQGLTVSALVRLILGGFLRNRLPS